MRPWPTASEAALLRFVLRLPNLRVRYLCSGILLVAGTSLWVLLPGWGIAGLCVALLGHLPLWVRTQTTAPGGATPAHEDVWAPVEPDWLRQVANLERKGEDWDTTPWDVTNRTGLMTLLLVILAIGVASFGFGVWGGSDAALRLAGGSAVVLVPLWFNGLRTLWNPSELRIKGQALEVGQKAAEAIALAEFEAVPMLALREGRRGKYPVDARTMLRPAQEDGTGFIGVQLQVAINSVRGVDYPYLYAVVLGKKGFRFDPKRNRLKVDGVKLVHERGESEGVHYLVIRQHADREGGWHTEPEHIRVIVRAAIDASRHARADSPRGTDR
jgi:hypothetical protein